MKALNWIVVAGGFGALGIAIGAFGAHGLPTWLAEQDYQPDEIGKRLATLETGARYHMFAALALLGVGVAVRLRPASQAPASRWAIAGWLLLVGATIFSGLLYVLAIAGPDWRWLGAVVPVGGLLQIAGWGMIALAARHDTSES